MVARYPNRRHRCDWIARRSGDMFCCRCYSRGLDAVAGSASTLERPFDGIAQRQVLAGGHVGVEAGRDVAETLRRLEGSQRLTHGR